MIRHEEQSDLGLYCSGISVRIFNKNLDGLRILRILLY